MATVLLVEDHPDLSEVLGQMLEMHGHSVRHCVSGEEALAALADGTPRPDALIIDQRLPGISGTELLKELKKNPNLLGVPIVVYSAEDSQRDAARQAGAHDFWLKGTEGLFEGVRRLSQHLSDGKQSS